MLQTPYGKFQCQDEHALLALLDKHKDAKFPVAKQVADATAVYDLKWYENRLHILE